MKSRNRLFSGLYKEVVHVGSSYEDLRLDGPGDFDLNLVLDIDIPEKNIRLEYDKGVWPGYANVVVVGWDGVVVPSDSGLSG